MTKQFKALTIDTEEQLEKIIDLVFEKVIFMQLVKNFSIYYMFCFLYKDYL